jgi:hypothetical protein
VDAQVYVLLIVAAIAAAAIGRFSNSPLTLLEIASGDADMIPQMLACDAPGSRYISANMNKLLTAGLRKKTRDLPISVEVIEDDAAAIDERLPAGCADLIAFQHAVNDVWQAILCDQEGIDTTGSDWMETLPAMIAIMQRETAENTLERNVKPGWLALLGSLAHVLKPGGLAAMNHYMFQLDLDWGYPPALWENIIPLAREWSRGIPGWKEVTLDGFDPQWWLFLKKEQ